MKLSILLISSLVFMLSSIFHVWAQAPKRAKIVFTSTRNSNAEIYVMNADGSQQIRLTHHPGDDFDPTWSPTGEHIAFVSERGQNGVFDIYLMDANGKNIRPAFDQLTIEPRPLGRPMAKESPTIHTHLYQIGQYTSTQ